MLRRRMLYQTASAIRPLSEAIVGDLLLSTGKVTDISHVGTYSNPKGDTVIGIVVDVSSVSGFIYVAFIKRMSSYYNDTADDIIFPGGGSLSQAITLFDGYERTSQQIVIKGDNAIMANAATNFNGNFYPSGTSSSGQWFLPSGGELYLMFPHLSLLNSVISTYMGNTLHNIVNGECSSTLAGILCSESYYYQKLWQFNSSSGIEYGYAAPNNSPYYDVLSYRPFIRLLK